MKKYTELSIKETRDIIGGGRPLINGANGYLTRDKNGRYRYVVTKTPAEAVTGVVVNGWASAAAGGWK